MNELMPLRYKVSMRARRGVELFLVSAKVVVVITAVAKVVTLLKHPAALELIDSVTTIRFWKVMTIALLMECALLILLWSRIGLLIKALSLLYFSLITGAYRVVAHMADQSWCPCLGSFGGWAALTQHQVNMLLSAIVMYLFVGSVTSVTISYKCHGLSP
jgi:hypothetical protein